MNVKLFSTLIKHIYALPINSKSIQLLLKELKEEFNSRSLGIHIIDRENLHVISELVSDTKQIDIERYAIHFNDLLPYLPIIRESENSIGAREIYIFKDNRLSRLEHASDLFMCGDSTPNVFSLLFREGSYLVQIALVDEHLNESAYQNILKNVSLLRPHIHNAFQIFHEFEYLRSHSLGFGQTMDQFHSGVILFDGNGDSVYLNRRAKEMISYNTNLSIISGKVIGPKSAITQGLRRIIHNAIHAGMDNHKKVGAIHIQTPQEDFIAIAIPMQPETKALIDLEKGIFAALILGVTEQPDWLNPEILQVLFQLTPAEAKFAIALSNGKSIEQYATLTGVSVNTIRGYLKTIFQKTNTNRQAELVALIRSSPPALLLVHKQLSGLLLSRLKFVIFKSLPFKPNSVYPLLCLNKQGV